METLVADWFLILVLKLYEQGKLRSGYCLCSASRCSSYNVSDTV